MRVVELPQHRNLRVQLGHLPRLHAGDVDHLARKLTAGSSVRCLDDPPVRAPPELLVLFGPVGREREAFKNRLVAVAKTRTGFVSKQGLGLINTYA